MDALTRTITPSAVPGSSTPGGLVRTGAMAARAVAAQPSAAEPATASATASAARASRRSAAHGPDLQTSVAQAQQALDYLARIAAQLEALKADLSTRLAGRGAALGAVPRQRSSSACNMFGLRPAQGVWRQGLRCCSAKPCSCGVVGRGRL
jgi:hypothetical protein